jgi:hypothetical protein
MIKVLTYHKENYYKDLKTSIPHNNIEKIKEEPRQKLLPTAISV